jgi:ABC-type uncharacterized transport system ATPase component
MAEVPNVVIAARNLYKVFTPSSSDEVIALQDVNLDVKAREFVSLIGHQAAARARYSASSLI